MRSMLSWLAFASVLLSCSPDVTVRCPESPDNWKTGGEEDGLAAFDASAPDVQTPGQDLDLVPVTPDPGPCSLGMFWCGPSVSGGGGTQMQFCSGGAMGEFGQPCDSCDCYNVGGVGQILYHTPTGDQQFGSSVGCVFCEVWGASGRLVCLSQHPS